MREEKGPQFHVTLNLILFYSRKVSLPRNFHYRSDLLLHMMLKWIETSNTLTQSDYLFHNPVNEISLVEHWKCEHCILCRLLRSQFEDCNTSNAREMLTICSMKGEGEFLQLISSFIMPIPQTIGDRKDV